MQPLYEVMLDIYPTANEILIARIGAFFSHAKSEYLLAAVYLNSEDKQKYPVGLKYLHKSANNGYSQAQHILGILYTIGEYGVERNYETSAQWFKLAANNNHKIAATYLANAYYNGEGVVRNLDLAHEWYTKSALQGWGNAQAVLARMYMFGIEGPEKDLKEAYKWSMLAKHYGSEHELEFMDKLIEQLSPQEINESSSEAKKLIKKIKC